MKVSCFCDPVGNMKMTLSELTEHLRKDCGQIRIQCEYCHVDKSEANDQIDQASFSRAQFKQHKCYLLMQKVIAENGQESFLYQKYKEEFEAKTNFKLEIKCFNKCGGIYTQNAFYAHNGNGEKFCSSCKGGFKREVISECQNCNIQFCEKCFMEKI